MSNFDEKSVYHVRIAKSMGPKVNELAELLSKKYGSTLKHKQVIEMIIEKELKALRLEAAREYMPE